ncbi:sensor histidine kinase [Thermomonas sp.]
MLWQPASVMWVILATEALSIMLALAPGVTANRWIYFGLSSLLLQWIALLALAATYLLRGPLSRVPLVHMTWSVVAVLLLSTSLVGCLAWLLLHPFILPLTEDGWMALLRILGLVLVAGILGALAFQNHWKSRLVAVRAQQAELESLQARIRPHFLFNTLNTGAALVHAHPDEAERLLLDLADLFRSALRGPQLIPLADELSLTQRYLDIESLRFGERLRLEWNVPASLPEVMAPSLSIQPLAENAIRHGIERLPQGGRVDVTVEVIASEVIVTVGNDLPMKASDSAGHAVGLASARERVDAMTDGRGRVESSVENGRFVARMVLPLQSISGSPRS